MRRLLYHCNYCTTRIKVKVRNKWLIFSGLFHRDGPGDGTLQRWPPRYSCAKECYSGICGRRNMRLRTESSRHPIHPESVAYTSITAPIHIWHPAARLKCSVTVPERPPWFVARLFRGGLAAYYYTGGV